MVEAVDKVVVRVSRKRKELDKYHWARLRNYIEVEMRSAVVQECKRIVEAAKVKPTIHKLLGEYSQAKKDFAAKLRKERKELRGEDKEIRQKIKRRKLVASRLRESILQMRTYRRGPDYPPVPKPDIYPSEDGKGIPETSGVYFLWKGEEVVYVGKSVNLNGRLRVGGHHRLEHCHRISFVETEYRILDWAECFYIGILQPYDNFGKGASHRRSLDL